MTTTTTTCFHDPLHDQARGLARGRAFCSACGEPVDLTRLAVAVEALDPSGREATWLLDGLLDIEWFTIGDLDAAEQQGYTNGEKDAMDAVEAWWTERKNAARDDDERSLMTGMEADAPFLG